MKKFALYVHIPFCRHKCDYCNFVSFTDTSYVDEYFSSIKKEISMYKEKYPDASLYSIYFGGGTPSLVQADKIVDLLAFIKSTFKCPARIETTIECNPGTVDFDKLLAYKSAGFNRLSIGGQSCNDKLLKMIGRIHTFKDIKTTIRDAKKVGFDNINVDMMIGLPCQTMKDVKKMAKFLTKNHIQHVSAYSLILENGTKLNERISVGDLNMPDEDDVVQMYDVVRSILEKKGIMRYEVSNFSLPDNKCKHNIYYWTLGEYIGVGVAAHSYVDKTRWANSSELLPYLASIKSNILPIVEKEKLSIEQRKEEMLMLRLRLVKGVHIDKFNRDFHCNILLDKAKDIEFLVKNNYISIKNGYLKLNPNAFYVLNSIVGKLI